jgi:hypothetical protein
VDQGALLSAISVATVGRGGTGPATPPFRLDCWSDAEWATTWRPVVLLPSSINLHRTRYLSSAQHVVATRGLSIHR